MELVKPFECIHRYTSEHALRIRVFSPNGLYPRGVVVSAGCLYFASDEIVFTAVMGQPYGQSDSDFPYSEMCWVTSQEVRFWSSIILCEDTDGPRILFSPEYTAIGMLEPSDIDLTNTENQKRLSHLVTEELSARRSLRQNHYSLFEGEVNLERQPQFYMGIGDSDSVLLRGMTCLIKCDMLSRHIEFAEEATIVAFISLDASFTMVSEVLRAMGLSNPTAFDAGKWLDDTFNRPIGIDPGDRKYFEDIYEQRILTVHPASRFGACPFAPLMMDDLFDLRRDLREVFAYLVSGQHGPEFERRREASSFFRVTQK